MFLGNWIKIAHILSYPLILLSILWDGAKIVLNISSTGHAKFNFGSLSLTPFYLFNSLILSILAITSLTFYWLILLLMKPIHSLFSKLSQMPSHAINMYLSEVLRGLLVTNGVQMIAYSSGFNFSYYLN